MRRRIGVPWLARLPWRESAVSACASKWTIPIWPQPTAVATAVAAGQVIEWSPPRMTGKMPRSATWATRARIAACEASTSPCEQIASPKSTTSSSSKISIPKSRWNVPGL